jgi:Acylphosphatases
MPTIHLIIKGEVQGVFFRATAKKIADKLDVKGWIKNREDDDVEAMVTGSQQQLEEFVNWCRKGPEKAKVEDVIVTQEKETLFNDFEVIRRK